MAYAPVNGANLLLSGDDEINAALADIAGWRWNTTEPTNTVAGMKWVDSDDPRLPLRVRNSANNGWKILYYLGTQCGPTIDDGTNVWELRATGLTDSWGVDLPPDVGATGQSMRIASIDGNGIATMEWYTAAGGVAAIGDLSDVDNTSPQVGEALVWGGSAYAPGPVSGGGPVDLDDLTDVAITNGVDGDFLRHNGTSFVDALIQVSDIPDLSSLYLDAAAALDDLSTVSAGSPSTGSYLRWNGSIWEDAAIQLSDMPGIALNDLSDVTGIGLAAPFDILAFNGTQWTPSSLSNSFVTLADGGTLSDLASFFLTGIGAGATRFGWNLDSAILYFEPEVITDPWEHEDTISFEADGPGHIVVIPESANAQVGQGLRFVSTAVGPRVRPFDLLVDDETATITEKWTFEDLKIGNGNAIEFGTPSGFSGMLQAESPITFQKTWILPNVSGGVVVMPTAETPTQGQALVYDTSGTDGLQWTPRDILTPASNATITGTYIYEDLQIEQDAFVAFRRDAGSRGKLQRSGDLFTSERTWTLPNASGEIPVAENVVQGQYLKKGSAGYVPASPTQRKSISWVFDTAETARGVHVWRSDGAYVVLRVLAYRDGGATTDPVVQARRNGSDILSSDNTLSVAGTWEDGGALAETALAVTDDISFHLLTGSEGAKVTIQLDLERAIDA